MKLSKFFAVVFAVFGCILMAGTVAVCLLCRNMDAKMTQLPQEARLCSEQFMEALRQGDFETAEGLIYSQPELGASTAPEDEISAQVWEAFRESITYTFAGDIYAQGAEVYRDAAITTLDIASVTEAMPGISEEILARRQEAAEETPGTSLYDASGMLRQEVRESILREAAAQAVAGGKTVTYETTLHLVRQDGRWWAVPDQTLRTAISGGAA